MRTSIYKIFALGVLIGGVSTTAASAASIIEQSCVCQGYGISGDGIPSGDTVADNLAQARKEAIESCRAGLYYRTNPEKRCTIPACPAGTIDITPRDANGHTMLIDFKLQDGDIRRTFDQSRSGGVVVERHNPSAAGCQRLESGRYQCSITGQIKHQCAY